MNRGILVQRGVPDDDELVETAKYVKCQTTLSAIFYGCFKHFKFSQLHSYLATQLATSYTAIQLPSCTAGLKLKNTMCVLLWV